MMLDRDIVAVSPSSTWRVLSKAGLLDRWNKKPGKINLGVLSALVEWFNIYVFLAKIVGTGIAFLWNFISRQLWVFERN